MNSHKWRKKKKLRLKCHLACHGYLPWLTLNSHSTFVSKVPAVGKPSIIDICIIAAPSSSMPECGSDKERERKRGRKRERERDRKKERDRI